MTSPVIAKRPEDAAAANLPDYSAACNSFTWDATRAELGVEADGPLNIAQLVLTRQLAAGRGDVTALRFLGAAGVDRQLTYAELADAAARFAAVLADLGVMRGDRVFGLSGRRPELYTVILGSLWAGAVFCPLFSAFGPDPVRQRLLLGDGRVLVTTASLYARKVASMRAALPGLRHVLLYGPGAGTVDDPGVMPLEPLLAAAAPAPVAPTGPEDMALLHFTSGTTGTPKGAVHVHEAVLSQYRTARDVLDLREGDTYWCTADPGWVTGTAYGVVGPLACGVTSVVDEEEFDAARWYRVLDEHAVSVWYTAPTALRMLVRAGDTPRAGADLSRLRHVASVGEPLNPEVVRWGVDHLGRPVHDTWWQTETGSIMVANTAADEIRPGSMGRPVPGVTAALVRRSPDGEAMVGDDGEPVMVTEPDTEGVLALRTPWPSMMRAYLGDEARYRACFRGGWYLSGDLARRDADGWLWFVGRGDDVIKSAGHLIGPFEVESVLMEHPDVAEAGVIGVPDPVAGEVVKAFVSLRAGVAPGEALRRDLMALARRRLGPAVAPRGIEFREDLPRTRSGKIMRRLLRARELGLPEGDLSTLEAGR